MKEMSLRRFMNVNKGNDYKDVYIECERENF